MSDKEALLAFKKRRNTLLPICLIMDIIGIFTYTIPGLGESVDFIWAPFAAAVYYYLFKGKIGFFGGSFAFIEELMPGTDVIPSFTITWILKFIIFKI